MKDFQLILAIAFIMIEIGIILQIGKTLINYYFKKKREYHEWLINRSKLNEIERELKNKTTDSQA